MKVISLFVLFVVLFSFAQAQVRRSGCCCSGGWILAAPLDHTMECLFQHDYFSLQGDVEFTGYAAELDSCAFCGDCNEYCDDDNDGIPRPAHSDRYELPPTDIDVVGGCGNTRVLTKTWSRLCGATTLSVNQVVTIRDTISPEVFAPPAQSQECISTNGVAGPDVAIADFDKYFGSARATDLCTNPTWTAYTAAPGAVTSSCITNFVRTFTATDGCTPATTQTQAVSFVDTTPPVIEVEAFITTTCPSTEVTTPTVPTVRDACDNAIGRTPVSSDTRYPGKCTGDFSIERIWSVSDTCNNAGYATQIIVVEDITPPTVTPAPLSTVENVVCNVNPAFPEYVVTDACGGPAYLSMEETISGMTEHSEHYDLIRSYKASDDCGNYITWEKVYVVDLGSGTTLTLTDPPVNPYPTSRATPIDLSFALTGVVCNTAYLVFDIGAADFVSISLPDCTDSNGGPIYCPIPPPGGPLLIDLTIVVPDTYLPDTLQVRFSVAQTDPTIDFNISDPHFFVIQLN